MRLSGLFCPLAILGNKIKVPEVSFSNSKSDGKTRFQARNNLRHSEFGKIIEQSTIILEKQQKENQWTLIFNF
jgi:hypothetical protein